MDYQDLFDLELLKGSLELSIISRLLILLAEGNSDKTFLLYRIYKNKLPIDMVALTKTITEGGQDFMVDHYERFLFNLGYNKRSVMKILKPSYGKDDIYETYAILCLLTIPGFYPLLISEAKRYFSLKFTSFALIEPIFSMLPIKLQHVLLDSRMFKIDKQPIILEELDGDVKEKFMNLMKKSRAIQQAKEMPSKFVVKDSRNTGLKLVTLFRNPFEHTEYSINLTQEIHKSLISFYENMINPSVLIFRKRNGHYEYLPQRDNKERVMKYQALENDEFLVCFNNGHDPQSIVNLLSSASPNFLNFLICSYSFTYFYLTRTN
jgi:hypothetical protein